MLTSNSFFIAQKNLRVDGFEAEIKARPIRELQLFANVGTLDDKVLASTAPGFVPGLPLREAPALQWKIGGEYRRPFTERGDEFFISGDTTYTSSYSEDDTDSLSVKSPSYTLIDASIGVESYDGHYRLSVQGKNLTNVVYWQSGVAGLERFYSRPRTIEAELTIRY